MVSRPRYDYSAINQLALNDTGHFVFLDSWSISLLASMLGQNMPLWFWTNNQFPLSQSEIDDLENKLATAQGALMQTLVGMIYPICTDDVPDGCLLCDGTTQLRTDYPNLYAKLDAAYIVDADHFVTPDLQDRFVVGTGLDHPVNETGGSATITQTVEQMPAHAHTTQPHAHSEVAAVPTIINGGLEAPASAATPAAATTGTAVVLVDDTGGGQPMNITPPFLSLRYVVVAL